MSYRIVKVTTFYRDFLRSHYEHNPGLAARSYSEQYADLMSQGYGWSDYFSRELRLLGTEAFEIVSNAEHMQHAWAEERGISAMGGDIVAEQIKEIKPDVVFLQDSYVFNGEWVDRLRESVPSIRTVIGWCCAPFSTVVLERFSAFDAVLVCSRGFKKQIEDLGLPSYELHHAFEPSILPKLAHDNPYPPVDLIFTGSVIPGAGFHDVRQKLLEYLIGTDTSIDLYANIPRISAWDLFLRRSAYAASKGLAAMGMKHLASTLPLIGKAYWLQEMPRRHKHIERLAAMAKKPVYGLEMFKALSRSRIGFNNHGEVAGEYAANIRMFEVTGVGACLLTDWKKNIGEFFEPDTEIVTYRTAEECVEKVKWLLAHPAECAAIAHAGQERTLRDHTFHNRALELDTIIRTVLQR
ncbi:MAG: glycosyltransferase [Acidobacteriota bacterium]